MDVYIYYIFLKKFIFIFIKYIFKMLFCLKLFIIFLKNSYKNEKKWKKEENINVYKSAFRLEINIY